MGSPSGAADSGRPAALAPAIIEALAVVRRKVRRDKRVMAVYSHDFGSTVSYPGKDRHDPCRSPDLPERPWRRLRAHHRAAPRPRRPRLRRPERHDPARAGRLRHAGAAPDQHRHGPASRRAVRGGRRSQPRLAGLRRLERRRQPHPRAPLPRGRLVGRRRHRHPRRPRRGARRSWRPGTGSTNRPADGIRTYEDFREMLEKETDIQGVVDITPDHQHGAINIAALRKGKAAISHKPVASVLHEVRRTIEAARASAAPSHLLAYSNTPDRHTLAAWIQAGVIGHVREVHNWTNRPFWPQGMQAYHASGPTVPEGFNWTLWQGPEPDRPYHPSYTFAVYRGWYAYGTGLPRRHGPLQPVAALPYPEARRARVGRGTAEQRGRRRRAERQHRADASRRSVCPSRASSAGGTRRRPIARRSTRSGTTAA